MVNHKNMKRYLYLGIGMILWASITAVTNAQVPECTRDIDFDKINTAFVSPWDIFTKKSVVRTECASDTAKITIGSRSQDNYYIWHKGYYGAKGKPFTESDSVRINGRRDISGQWIIGSGDVEVRRPTTDQDAQYFVFYMCIRENGEWRCGCSEDGKCSAPEKNDFRWSLVQIDTVTQKKECQPTGCGGQICSDRTIFSTCQWKESYACYRDAQCERQADGECGWTQTLELEACLEKKTSAQVACEERGGTWRRAMSGFTCFESTRDAGKACTNARECEIACEIETVDQKVGTCYGEKPFDGCIKMMDNGVFVGEVCT